MAIKKALIDTLIFFVEKGKIMRKRKTTEEFKNEIEALYPGKYTILGEYTKRAGYIKVKYNKCGHIMERPITSILDGKDCMECNHHSGSQLNNDEFLKRFHDLFGNDYQPLDEYVNYKQNMHIKHIPCGNVFVKNINNMFTRKKCTCIKCESVLLPYCITGVNDIATKNPEMASLLKYHEDAFKYTPHSSEKLWFICPYCGNEIFRKATDVASHGLKCRLCNTNYSYGERFIVNLFMDFNIDYIPQFSPEWIKPFRYDFYFIKDNIKYIIEIDGGWHFQDNRKNGMTYSEIHERDTYKQKAAEKHNIVVIRLDYNYKSILERNEYIIDSILKSKLSDIFNFDNYDFKNIIEQTTTPIVRRIADIWNSYDVKSSQRVQHDLKLDPQYVLKYLYMASDLNLIKETKEEIRKLNRSYGIQVYGHHRKKKVQCIETGEIFNTHKEAERKYHASLYGYFHCDNIHYSGHLPDGTRLTWKELN